MKKPVLIGSIALGVATLGAVGIASAATINKPNSLASEIATKFHLNQGDVQNVIDTHKSEAKDYRAQNYQQRLDDAVTNKTISSAQKDLILTKHNELISFLDTLKGKSPQDRRTAMQQERADIDTWAKQNNVPANLIFGPDGHGMRGGQGVGAGMMGRPDGA